MTDERVRGNAPGQAARTVAERVGAIRRKRGLSAKELAEQMTAAGRRMSADSVMKLESNARRVDADDLVTLANVLNCSVIDLLTPELAASEVLELAERVPLLHKQLSTALSLGYSVEQVQRYVRAVAFTRTVVAQTGDPRYEALLEISRLLASISPEYRAALEAKSAGNDALGQQLLREMDTLSTGILSAASEAVRPDETNA